MIELAGPAMCGTLPGFAAAFLLARFAAPRWLSAAFAVALLVAYGLLKSWPALPWALASGNNDGTQWLVWSVCATAIVAIAGEGRGHALAPMGCVLLLAQAWVMLTNVRAQWSPMQAAIHGTAAGIALLLLYALLAQSMRRRRGTSFVLLMLSCFVADAVVLALGGCLLLAQLASAMAATLAGILVTARWHPQLQEGVALVLASAHGGLLLAGHHFAEPASWALLAAAVAPAVTWTWTPCSTRRRRGGDPHSTSSGQ